MNDGDWICCDPQCSNVNFARRTSCNRCGKGCVEGSKIDEEDVTEMTSDRANDPASHERKKAAIPPRKKLGHEIGKAAAEKSRGLFSADDWQCGRCGNVNWARRQQCNMCNAPKFGEVEERTGLGGGYNERENVEYIERVESDGEYDDFGRKKKKYRGNDEPPVKGKPNQPKQEKIDEEKPTSKYNEEEEEEDDDDDDSADLSKYDLTGWGDESPKDRESKRSRSGSQSSVSSRSSVSARSRSSSNSSQSSRSPSPSSSESGKLSRGKRTHSRSRSSSIERNHTKRKRSRSPVHISNSRSRDRSDSNSPASHKR